jgi:hypothetical protein
MLRLAFSLFCSLLAFATLALATANASPTGPIVPVARKVLATPSPTPTPTAVPTSSATALPTALTMEVRTGNPGPSGTQQPLISPLLDFKLSGATTSSGRENSTMSIVMPNGSIAAQLESYFLSGTQFKYVYVFVPPNTLNAFELVKIASFNENASSSQSSVKFNLNFGAIRTTIVSPPTSRPLIPLNAKPIIPGHAP